MSLKEKDFQLLNNMIRKGKLNREFDLEKMKIINLKIFETFSKNAPPNFSYLYSNLEKDFQRFSNFFLNNSLRNKNIITLAGGFSSGKSSFINTLLDRIVLPADINPATSIPTYIVYGENSQATAHNNWDNIFNINLKDLKILSYGFAEHVKEDIEINHLIKNIVLETPYLEFTNLAFIDTPGYSKSESLENIERSDKELTKYYLNISDNIIWFISAEVGSITEDDLNILLQIKKEIPKLIIINKSDKLTEEDLKIVIQQVKSILDSKAVNYLDICGFSRRNPEGYDGKKIFEYLNSFNTKKNNTDFLKGFDEFFQKINNYYNSLLIIESRKLYRLNTAITVTDNIIVSETLLSLTEEIKDNMKNYTDLRKELNIIKVEFFTELKNLGLEINMKDIKENYKIKKDFLIFIQKYKQENNIKKDFENYKAIKDFGNLNLKNKISYKHKLKIIKGKNIIKNILNTTDKNENKIGFGKNNYKNIVKNIIKNI